MRILYGLVLSAGLLAGSGCVGHNPASEPTPGLPGAPAAATGQELIVTPDHALSGRIASVNPTLRFVVAHFSGGRMPAKGQRLIVYRQGLKVGEIKVSGPQYADNIVADIMLGEAAPGDDLRGE